MSLLFLHLCLGKMLNGVEIINGFIYYFSTKIQLNSYMLNISNTVLSDFMLFNSILLEVCKRNTVVLQTINHKNMIHYHRLS